MNYAFIQIKFYSKLAKCSGPNNPHPLDWLYDSLISTCSWFVVSALAPLSCGSHCIIQVDAGGWGETPPPPPPSPHVCKALWDTAIHNKALYKCIIQSFVRSFVWLYVTFFFFNRMKLFAARRDEDVIDPWVVTRFRCHTHTDTLAQFVVFDMVGSPVWAQAIMVRWHHTHNPQLSCWHTLHLHTRFRCAHTLHVRIHTPLCQD